jgi:truncated hemoglobin YjbI
MERAIDKVGIGGELKARLMIHFERAAETSRNMD